MNRNKNYSKNIGKLAVKKRENSEDKMNMNLKTSIGFHRSNNLLTDSNTLFKKKKRSDSVAVNIIEKFYMPFVKKHEYQEKITENISVIKKDTKKSVAQNYFLSKKKLELKKLKKEFIIYNNPSKKVV